MTVQASSVCLIPSSEKDYKSAQAFVITFLVNNNLDEEKNGPARAWEKAYIEFMKNYTKHSANVSIAYSSEVNCLQGSVYRVT